ncbi:MAG: carbohydrate ABC transporter substrate-binding protein [Alphaproteobacteria bacterium]|nr:carbohydrate ABC transporter substrate-binding protein [Alphaproteobacteria bacterium]
MTRITRRSVLGSTMALAAVGTIARPYVARAEAKTATAWIIQGFAQEEDIAMKKVIEDYEKASGNKIEYSIIPYAPIRQKIVSAITSGVVPDILQNTPTEVHALYAWDDKLVDITDVIETQKDKFTETALLSAYAYNNVTRKRAYYLAPYTSATVLNHIWRPLVEKAGYKESDIPKTWDAYYAFFQDLQKKLRAQGERRIYGTGFSVTTNGNDPNNQFNCFLLAFGGSGLVTKDGKLHLDDPQVKEAIIKALEFPTTAYKNGNVPPGAINWNDSDNNNAFHSKQVVMDIDGTISTEVAIIKNKQDYDDILTMGLPLDNNGKQIPSSITNFGGMIPKGAKNVEVAKDFLKFVIQPQVTNDLLKTGLGRNLPSMVSIPKNDPWWTADPHRKAYVETTLYGPTVPDFYNYNPAYAQVRNEHVWGVAWADIIQNGMTPAAAADKACKRVEDIFAKYPIEQS